MLPKPPLAEQRRIAETLATWDRAIERLEALTEVLAREQHGLMQRLLTGRLRVPA